MSRRKGIRPEQYAGIYQRYEDIPDRYRLQTFASQYEGEDTWQQYLEEVLIPEHEPLSDDMEKTIRLAEDSWQNHMEERERHHALAKPVDVEEWCRSLLDGRAPRTCYEHYYVRIYQFYEYLVSVNSHPHIYNPLLIAAIEHEHTNEIWRQRVERRPEVVDRE